MRYQTISMRKKTNPTSADAAYTPRGPTCGVAAAAGGLGTRRRCAAGMDGPEASATAASPAPRFTAAASHTVRCAPRRSIRTNVASTTPPTAPSVLMA